MKKFVLGSLVAGLLTLIGSGAFACNCPNCNCSETVCSNPECTCGCREGKECTCDEIKCNCENDCTCGCKENEECNCDEKCNCEE